MGEAQQDAHSEISIHHPKILIEFACLAYSYLQTPPAFKPQVIGNET